MSKTFGSRPAVIDVSLEVRPGEVLGLLGPNGAGKTTTVKMLLGLVRPDAGRALLFGRDAADPVARRQVGYLPETFAQPPWATATQVLRSHARILDLATEDDDDRHRGLLHRVGLAGRGDERVGGFSKGMRQRLGLAVALLGEPGLVVLDEPTSALDPIGRREVRDIIRDLRRDGIAVLLNSHLLAEVEQICDRVAVMREGRLLADLPVSNLPVGEEVRVTLDIVTPELIMICQGHGVLHHSDSRSIVLLLDDREGTPDLVASLAAAGGRVRALVPLQSGLEEVFVRLIEQQPLEDQEVLR